MYGIFSLTHPTQGTAAKTDKPSDGLSPVRCVNIFPCEGASDIVLFVHPSLHKRRCYVLDVPKLVNQRKDTPVRCTNLSPLSSGAASRRCVRELFAVNDSQKALCELPIV